MESKVKTPYELLAERSWTEFLKSLPVATTSWRIEDYRDFVSLRTTASILSNKEGADRSFSLIQNKSDKTIYEIEVTLK